MSEVKKQEYIIPGLSLFFVTFYAPFTIAALLASKYQDTSIGYLVSVSFLVMAIGTFLSAKFTKAGLVVAPGIGIVTFFTQTASTTISNRQFLFAAFLAAVVAFLLSVRKHKTNGFSYRQVFLDRIPSPVKIGIRGGIGALLAAVAIYGLKDAKSHLDKDQFNYVIFGFIAGVSFILLSEIIQRFFERQFTLPRKSVFVVLTALRCAPFVVPISLFGYLHLVGIADLAVPGVSFQLPGSLPIFHSSPVSAPFSMLDMLVFFSFASIILFMFLTDIPGSLYDLLKVDHGPSGEAGRKADRPFTIDRSFAVTSAASAINPFFGLSASVYYAENHIVIDDDHSSPAINNPAIGYFCAVAYFVFFVIFGILDFPIPKFKEWLFIAISPVLFYLGIRLTTRALHREMVELKEAQQAISMSTLVPMSFTVILTHFVGFELALPLGIVYFWLSRFMYGENTEDFLSVLTIMSGLIVIFISAAKLGFG